MLVYKFGRIIHMYLEITLCLQLATRGDVGELLNDNKFRRMTVIDEDNFEVEMSKKKIIKILPKQVGFFILDYSKLRMLQFYHEVIDPNISRDDFGYVEMDTDSAYISGEELNMLSMSFYKRRTLEFLLYGKKCFFPQDTVFRGRNFL